MNIGHVLESGTDQSLNYDEQKIILVSLKKFNIIILLKHFNFNRLKYFEKIANHLTPSELLIKFLRC